MQGDHPRQHVATPGRRYAPLVDVAGEDESGGLAEGFASGARRDSTALTVVEVDGASGRAPIYRVVDRMRWTGTRHTVLCDRLTELARNVWRADRVVIDATGIGAGLASFLAARLQDRAIGPVIQIDRFISASRARANWDGISSG